MAVWLDLSLGLATLQKSKTPVSRSVPFNRCSRGWQWLRAETWSVNR